MFYSFNLDRHVLLDHLLRSIDRFVDLSGVRQHLQTFYSNTGRPSVDPELMIRMLIVGYVSASAQNAGFVTKSISTSVIAGFVG